MGGNPETGELRELNDPAEIIAPEVLFKHGELINIKGCIFKVQQICGSPHNTITLKMIGTRPQQESNNF